MQSPPTTTSSSRPLWVKGSGVLNASRDSATASEGRRLRHRSLPVAGSSASRKDSLPVGLPRPRTATSRCRTCMMSRPSCSSGLVENVHWNAKGPRLRSQSFLPPTSNATSSPVPKKKKTSLPSVTGDGEQELLYWPSVEYSLMSARQSCRPVLRSRQIAACCFVLASAAVTKTRSPQMTGVAADEPGRSTAHFTPSVLLNLPGRPFSGLEPLCSGPRQLDQFSAWSATVEKTNARGSRRRIMGRNGLDGDGLTSRLVRWGDAGRGDRRVRGTSKVEPLRVKFGWICRERIRMFVRLWERLYAAT